MSGGYGQGVGRAAARYRVCTAMVSDEWVGTAMVYSVGTAKVIQGLVDELVIAFQLYVTQYHQHKNGTHLQNAGVQQVPEPVQPRERKARGLDPHYLRPWPLLLSLIHI